MLLVAAIAIVEIISGYSLIAPVERFHVLVSVLVLVSTFNSSTCYLKY